MIKHALLALASPLVAGCATIGGPSDAQLRYDAGVEALARRDYAAATSGLQYASDTGDDDLARRALLMLAAVQLDPDNPRRDPDAASDVAARLREGAQPGSVEYLAAGTLERIARESRDLRQDLTAARGERDRAWTQMDSLRVRVDASEAQRDSLMRVATRLQMVGDSLDKELKKTTQELERIRRIIRD